MKAIYFVACLFFVAATIMSAARAQDRQHLYVAPYPDKQCMGSPVHLGTDNIPLNGDPRASSVMDIHAIALARTSPAIAWIYVTENGRNWLQGSVLERPAFLAALKGSPTYAVMQKQRVEHDGLAPMLVTPADLREVNRAATEHGFSLQQCFTHPLPSTYL
jgi:hypothetical protein